MKISDLLHGFRHRDARTQDLLENVAQQAYAQGRRDQGNEMTRIAAETEKRINSMLNPVDPMKLHGSFATDDIIH